MVSGYTNLTSRFYCQRLYTHADQVSQQAVNLIANTLFESDQIGEMAPGYALLEIETEGVGQTVNNISLLRFNRQFKEVFCCDFDTHTVSEHSETKLTYAGRLLDDVYRVKGEQGEVRSKFHDRQTMRGILTTEFNK